MGNHSETAELLEEAREVALTEKNGSFGDTLIDEFGNAIRLDQSPEELESKAKPANPTKLKDSSGRDVELVTPEAVDGLTLKQIEKMKAKDKKKKTS